MLLFDHQCLCQHERELAGSVYFVVLYVGCCCNYISCQAAAWNTADLSRLGWVSDERGMQLGTTHPFCGWSIMELVDEFVGLVVVS